MDCLYLQVINKKDSSKLENHYDLSLVIESKTKIMRSVTAYLTDHAFDIRHWIIRRAVC